MIFVNLPQLINWYAPPRHVTVTAAARQIASQQSGACVCVDTENRPNRLRFSDGDLLASFNSGHVPILKGEPRELGMRHKESSWRSRPPPDVVVGA